VQVAIKLFDKKAIQEEYVRDTLQREGTIMRALRHPHIVQLYEEIENDDIYCLVMRKAAGDLLAHLCQDGVLPEPEARRLFRQLVSAIECMHVHGFVHRDLKIENMLFDAQRNLVLVDFGLSSRIAPHAFLTTQCGSMAYSAPELLGKKPYGKEVDVWSAGVCLFAMLTGTLPFPADGLTDQHAHMLDGNYKLPAHTSPELRHLFTRLFEVGRPGSCPERALAHPPLTGQGAPAHHHQRDLGAPVGHRP
jgi:serine/threonine protein kinase